MARSRRPERPQAEPLAKWLALDWNRPERSYNPDVRDFLAGLLDYPRDRVVTEDTGGGGYPDIKLVTPEKVAWVVGDLKKDDAELNTSNGRQRLWHQKRKYVEGLTRYVLFLTAHYLWVVLPDGSAIQSIAAPIHLLDITLEELREKLKFLSYEQAGHLNQWATFIEGKLPYIYLKLNDRDTLDRLRQDLQAGFAELSRAAELAIRGLAEQYDDYKHRKQEIERNLVGTGETQRRALGRLNIKSDFVRRLFEDILPQFEEQYGREVTANNNGEAQKRIREAFIADSVATLIARVLFLRLVEDLKLTKRRLSNGGPQDWAAFVDQLTGDARALVRLVAEDVGRLYRKPFERNVFDWIYQANGVMEEALQRLILRFNAYDFAGLSEELLGEIYQEFLPTAKRKRLGEFYTPASIVDWLLEQTVWSHEPGRLLDPSCGSGSFLVRYVHRKLEDAKTRGLDAAEVRREVQNEVWGFDLNPFAAFISHFQLMWALLRFSPKAEPPQIHVYNLNSLLRDRDLVPYLGEDYLPPGSQERDTGQWKYIVGNPPYIRAERVKYGEEMRGLWQQVWGQNADTGLVFLYRALTESLESGGFLGMVISGGYANSEAAAKVWKLLYPGRDAALRKLVWLEFTDKPIWEVARVPLILVIERTPAKEDDEIALYVPSTWRSEEPPVKVKYKDFFDYRVNPRVTEVIDRDTREGLYGEYLLPLLQADDVPILRKLHPNGNGNSPIVELKEAVAAQISRNNRPFWWTYGIQRGGTEVTPEPTGEKPVQVIAGRSLAVGWHGEPAGWIDLESVKNRPYGKLSLWATQTHSTFIVVSELAKVPFASVVNGTNFAAVNTVIIALPKPNNPSAEAIAAYINSKLARFYWALRLRSGVIQGYYAHVYPRTLEALPWLRTLDSAIEQGLVNGYNELARFATVAKNNPDEWLLSEVETRIVQQRYKLSDPRLGLNFSSWSTEDVLAAELSWDGQEIRAGLFSLQFIDVDLAELVHKLLTLNTEEDTSLSRGIIQKLVVPQSYAALMQDYRQRLANFQQVEADFFAVLHRIDEAVYEAFGITEAEKTHIETRLSNFPLNKLQPRYPWQTVRPRPIRAYTEDRFA